MGALSRGLLLILAVELACYAVIAQQLHPTVGWTATFAMLAGIGLSIRAVPILLSYAIALTFSSPVPPKLRIEPLTWVRYAVQEVGVAVLLYTVLHPFERWTMARDATAGGRSPPVLLVHGYLCNRALWWSLRRWLAARGHAVFTLDLEPVFGDIDGYAGQIARRMEEICHVTSAATVTLIGGSMGGLAIRAFLRAHGPLQVARVITLGTPHHGSGLARLAPGRNGRQMQPGSAWLAALAAFEAGRVPVPFMSIYGCHDNLVVPQTSSRLEGADNRPLAGVGHLSLAFSPAVRDALADVL